MPKVTGLTTTATVITSLSVGTTYQFKIVARNSFGTSEYSETVSILAAQIPDKPVAPTTVFDRTTVVISWTAPFDQGSEITGYQVFIRESDEVTFTEDLTNCNRLTSPTLTCTIPVIALKTTPYEIVWGEHIYAKVTAINVYGLSLTSDAGNGAEIITYPDVPTLLSEEFQVRTATSITLTWVEGAANGGASVIDYQVTYDEASGTDFVILESNIEDRTYKVDSLTSGATYIFKV